MDDKAMMPDFIEHQETGIAFNDAVNDRCVVKTHNDCQGNLMLEIWNEHNSTMLWKVQARELAGILLQFNIWGDIRPERRDAVDKAVVECIHKLKGRGAPAGSLEFKFDKEGDVCFNDDKDYLVSLESLDPDAIPHLMRLYAYGGNGMYITREQAGDLAKLLQTFCDTGKFRE